MLERGESGFLAQRAWLVVFKDMLNAHPTELTATTAGDVRIV